MNINFFKKSDNQIVSYHLNGIDNERLTHRPWEDLYHEAQRKNIPYFLIIFAIFKADEDYKATCFDGYTFNRLSKAEQSLLLTNAVSVDNIFLHCFDVNKLTPLENPTVSLFSLQYLADEKIRALASFSLKNYPPADLGKIQYIVGTQLLNHPNKEVQIEGLHWMICASKHKLIQAKEFIKPMV